jgi:large subunit ribosomal protein L25
MDFIVLPAEKREVIGKKVKYLRAERKVPGILYGHGTEPVPVVVTRNNFDKVWRRAGGSTIVKLAIGEGETRNVLIHDVQLDPISNEYQHVDFYQVKLDEKIKAEVPIRFEGESPAVRDQEGILITNKSALEVECLPLDLPHELVVDLSSLKTFDDAIHIKDVKAPANVEILGEPEDVVAVVNPPRSEEELAALDEAIEEKVEEVELVEKEEKETEAEGEETAPAGEEVLTEKEK